VEQQVDRNSECLAWAGHLARAGFQAPWARVGAAVCESAPPGWNLPTNRGKWTERRQRRAAEPSESALSSVRPPLSRLSRASGRLATGAIRQP
jgi:hypothetical protein